MHFGRQAGAASSGYPIGGWLVLQAAVWDCTEGQLQGVNKHLHSSKSARRLHLAAGGSTWGSGLTQVHDPYAAVAQALWWLANI
jgi:hypothetical protein